MKPHQRSTSVKKLVRKVGKGVSTRFKRKKKIRHRDVFGNLVKQGASRPYSGFVSHGLFDKILRYVVRINKGVLSIDKVPIKFRTIVNKLVNK